MTFPPLINRQRQLVRHVIFRKILNLIKTICEPVENRCAIMLVWSFRFNARCQKINVVARWSADLAVKFICASLISTKYYSAGERKYGYGHGLIAIGSLSAVQRG